MIRTPHGRLRAPLSKFSTRIHAAPLSWKRYVRKTAIPNP